MIEKIVSPVKCKVEYLKTTYGVSKIGLITEDHYRVTCDDVPGYESAISKFKEHIVSNLNKDSGNIELTESNMNDKFILVKQKKIEPWR